MVSARQHIEALLRAERERVSLLFSFAMSIAVFVYWELGRRQRLGEGREDTRREYIDTELKQLNDTALGQRERAATRAGIVKGLYAIALAATPLIVYLLARHQI